MYHDIISKPHFMSKFESGFLVDLVEKSKGLPKVLALVGMVSTAVSAQAEKAQWKYTDCPDSMAEEGLTCLSKELEGSGALKSITISGKFVIGGLPVSAESLRNPDVKSAALKYKAHLEAIDLQVKGEQSCDDTDDDYEALWDDCNALHLAILNARENALDQGIEDSRDKDNLLAQKENTLTQHTLLQAKELREIRANNDKRAIEIAGLKALLATTQR